MGAGFFTILEIVIKKYKSLGVTELWKRRKKTRWQVFPVGPVDFPNLDNEQLVESLKRSSKETGSLLFFEQTPFSKSFALHYKYTRGQ